MKERIKIVRKDSGLSQTEFGERIGVKQNTVALYESGAREPSNSALALICKEFGVNESWLRTGSGDPYIEKTRNQEIAEFLDSVFFEGEDSFKHHFALALSRMDDAGWKALEKFINDFNS